MTRTWLLLQAGLFLAMHPIASEPAQSRQGDWVTEAPDGDTGCAFDTPFRFFHRDVEDASAVLVYFEGGGACWNWVSCSGLFDTSVAEDELAGFRGIFDRSNPDNPFRTFGMVFIPYCTGDVHVGATTAQYGEPATSRAIAHRGYRNVTAVLDWLTRRIQPDTIVVAGASAGAYGALFYTPTIARRYPDASVSLIPDSGVPLLSGYPAILEGWGASTVLEELWDLDAPVAPSNLDLEAAYTYASVGGRVRIGVITSDQDAVQGAFYLISGSSAWRAATYELLGVVEAHVPNAYGFVVAGADHGLLRTDRFYEFEADGTLLRDWVARLIRGDDMESVRCAGCGRP